MAACCLLTLLRSRVRQRRYPYAFFDVARLAKVCLIVEGFVIRSGVASKFIRNGRSTVTLRKPNSRFSKMREMTRTSLVPFFSLIDHFGGLHYSVVVAVDASEVGGSGRR